MVLVCHPESAPVPNGNKLFWHCFSNEQYVLWYTSSWSFLTEEIQSKLDNLTCWNDLKLGSSYSFILWDKPAAKYLIQVDEFATCPLFFLESQGTYYIADVFKELVDLFTLSLTINTAFVQDYLQPFSSTRLVHNQTVYNEIERIVPQHRLLISANENVIIEHYLANWVPMSEIHHSDEIIQQVRAHFTASICRFTETNNCVAANLSGGLDSSSIVSMLLSCKKNVHALYAVIDGKEADESFYIQAMEYDFPALRIDKIPVQPATYSAVQNTTVVTGQPDGMAAPSVLHAPLFEVVKANTISLFFSGHGGDSIIGTSEFYSISIWEKLDFRALRRWRTSPHFRPSQYRLAWINAAVAWRKKGILFYLVKQVHCFLHAVLPATYLKSFIRLLLQVPNKKDLPVSHEIMRLQTPNGLTSEQKKHWESHFSLITVTANELLYTLGRAAGTKVIFPFQDFQLFEWALCFASERNFAQGARRGLLREAMQDILPEEIRQRTSKATFTTYLTDSLRNVLQGFSENKEMSVQQKLFISEKDWLAWQNTKNKVLQNEKVSMKQIDKCFKITYFLIWLEIFLPCS